MRITVDEKRLKDGDSSKLANKLENSRISGKLDSTTSWLMVICALLINFVASGSGSILGIYLVHFSSSVLKDQSHSVLQLVAGSYGALNSLGSLPGSIMISKLGFNNTIIISGLIIGMGMTLTSFTTEIWHLFIGQSIMVGFATSLTFLVTVTLIPQWFNKYRGIALGIAVSGVGLGGLALAPIIQHLIEWVGIRWAIRINAITATVILIICGLIIRPRVSLPPPSKLVDFSIIFDKKFICFCAIGLFTGFGYYTPFYIIPFYCKYYSIPDTSASLILGLMNGGSAIGRILMGQVSKYIGSVNAMLVSQFIVSLSFVVIWHFSVTTWSLIIFVLIFGIFSGAFYTLSPLISPQLYGIEKLAQVNGPYFASLAPGCLVGPMISQVIISSYTTSMGDKTIINYLPMQFYLFASYLISCLFIIILRFQLTKKLVTKI